MNQTPIENELSQILSLNNNDDKLIIDRLDKLIQKNGLDAILEWRSPITKKKNTIAHELIEKKRLNVIQHLINKHNLCCNIHRESDGKTPADLARAGGHEALAELLEETDQNALNQEIQDDEESDSNSKSKMNIVWLDLEMTSIEEPRIMECAVIITDKYLHPLQRSAWVVHYDQKVLDSLGEWHQNQFKDVKDGGNGLFQDCIKSNLSEAEVESKLLALIQRYCPEKECPLGGSSIHIDKEVLKQRMPKVHDYLHYRIIDVSSFRGMLKRWAPRQESKFSSQLCNKGQETANHRAMNDIEYSIELMKLFFPMLTGRQYRNKRDVKKPSIASNEYCRSVGNFDVQRSRNYAEEQALEARLKLNKSVDIASLQLSSKFRSIYNRNPHLREVFIDGEKTMESVKEFKNDHRCLTLENQIQNGKPKMTQNITTEYWETRKLLLTDIEFLTKYAENRNYLVIYVGAAPGTHFHYLSDLFPKLDFVLIDKKSVETTKTSKIHIRSGDLMDDIVKEYSKLKKDLLLICNVYKFGAENNSDENFVEDMEKQKVWHIAMKPVASLLTIHTGHKLSKMKYFTGNIILEPWTSRSATSCRLVVLKDARPTEYDTKQLIASMTHFQNVARRLYYEHDVADSDSDGLDHCYDCRSEILILSEYLKNIQNVPNAQLLKAITHMSKSISEEIHEKTGSSIVNGIRTLAVIPKI